MLQCGPFNCHIQGLLLGFLRNIQHQSPQEKRLSGTHCSSLCPCKACTITLSFCCFAACVDVYGTHSNVHLRCFHTGKSTAIRAGPSMWKLPVSSSVIIISVIFYLCSVSLAGCLIAERQLPIHRHFICTARVWGHLFLIISAASCSLSFKSPLSNRFVLLVLSGYFWD